MISFSGNEITVHVKLDLLVANGSYGSSAAV